MTKGYKSRPWLNDVLSVVALVVLFVPAIQPLLQASFTCGYDNVFHLWRAVQFDHLWSHGVLYSRWAPDMALGFGFPLFVFMPPGTAMAAAFMHRLGLTWPIAINALFALGMVASGLLMFWLARDVFGGWAGVVAAVAYVYAPFFAYDVFNRGSLSESVAWIFPPLILWSIHRWAAYRQRRFLVVGALALAALVLCHQVFAFLFAPVFAAWVLLSGYLTRDVRAIGRGVLLGVVGLGIAAFFWLPALAEREWVQTGRLLGTWVFDFHYNFLSLDHVLALPRTADPLLINDWPQKAVGLVPALIALLPLARWRSYSRETRWRIAVLWLLALLMVILVLPLSAVVWERVPLLSFVQFPWRFLGPAAFCLALLSGAAVGASADAGRKPGWAVSLPAAGLVGALILANLGWFFPKVCSPPGVISPAAMIAWERATDTLGTTAKGEYLPVWVETLPDATAMDAAYAAGAPIARLANASLPITARIIHANHSAQRAVIEMETPEAFQARYLAFYYPGWQARVDGAAVDVTPEPETGLVTFPVPSGTHTVEVWFGETPVRWLADGVSAVSLIILVVLVVVQRKPENATHLPDPASPIPHILLLCVGAALVVFKLQVVDQRDVLWRETRLHPDNTLAGAEIPAATHFGNRAALLGYDRLPERFAADTSPVVTLYWRALDPGSQDWQVGLTFVGADGARWSPVSLRPVRWGRTPPPLAEWPREGYARMDFHVDLMPGMPPGVYTLMLSLFDRRSLEPASVLGADGNPLGPELVLGQVQVSSPQRPPTLATLDVPPDATLQRCGAVGLWSMTADRAQAAPGDPVALRWVWEAIHTPSMSSLVTLTLRDSAGAMVRAWNVPPSVSWWPTDRWQEGERWVGTPLVRVPGSAESGAYLLQVGLPGCEAMASVPLDIVAPERVWTVPDGFVSEDVTLGGVARLAGVALDVREVSAGQTVRLQLAWQAVAEMETSYRVFVHLVGADGRLLAQSDGEPAGWTRPTTGWAVGEVIIDGREVNVPADAVPGEYELRVGLYVTGGSRLLTPTGDDAIVLGTVVVR